MSIVQKKFVPSINGLQILNEKLIQVEHLNNEDKEIKDVKVKKEKKKSLHSSQNSIKEKINKVKFKFHVNSNNLNILSNNINTNISYNSNDKIQLNVPPKEDNNDLPKVLINKFSLINLNDNINKNEEPKQNLNWDDVNNFVNQKNKEPPVKIVEENIYQKHFTNNGENEKNKISERKFLKHLKPTKRLLRNHGHKNQLPSQNEPQNVPQNSIAEYLYNQALKNNILIKCIKTKYKNKVKNKVITDNVQNVNSKNIIPKSEKEIIVNIRIKLNPINRKDKNSSKDNGVTNFNYNNYNNFNYCFGNTTILGPKYTLNNFDYYCNNYLGMRKTLDFFTFHNINKNRSQMNGFNPLASKRKGKKSSLSNKQDLEEQYDFGSNYPKYFLPASNGQGLLSRKDA